MLGYLGRARGRGILLEKLMLSALIGIDATLLPMTILEETGRTYNKEVFIGRRAPERYHGKGKPPCPGILSNDHKDVAHLAYQIFYGQFV